VETGRFLSGQLLLHFAMTRLAEVREWVRYGEGRSGTAWGTDGLAEGSRDPMLSIMTLFSYQLPAKCLTKCPHEFKLHNIEDLQLGWTVH
jgi:hypothetical protein